MNPLLVIFIIVLYFGFLITISYFTSKNADSKTFFTANRQSPWFLVAFGMIGASLSGVTFISVPGEVGNSQFAYFQVVLGYLVGYLVIGTILLPLYYRLNLVSIYTYLQQRFGFWSYKTGAIFFLISRTIGSSFRLFLVAGVLQIAIFDAWGVPFWVTVVVTIILIWIYTFRGGIKTIVWTDTLQTFFMLTAVITSILLIKNELNLTFDQLFSTVEEHRYAQIFFWDWQSGKNFFKQFLSGAFIAIVMTGLDQDMMQKNLTCRSLKDAQKNVFWFSIILVLANLLFLSLGVLLYMYARTNGIPLPERTDDLYPLLALKHFSYLAGIAFLLGIVAAAYSSADSALTALTTSFCVDILNFEEKPENIKKRIRIRVHLAFSLLMLLVILVFKAINDESVINSLFIAAGYTYGPILGLFAFGLFSRRKVRDNLVLPISILSPLISFLINYNSEAWLFGYRFGFEILIVNGALTYLGLWLISKQDKVSVEQVKQ
ncbi:MAG: sodium:solute symporter [Candidatus Cyclobacteriaceae bacterium M3_2C_046]